MADGFLSDVKVLELGDEKGEFCGKLFAGAGADVIKVEPPGGGSSRAQSDRFTTTSRIPTAASISGITTSASAA